MNKRALCVALLLVIASFFATGSKINTLQEEWNKRYGGPEHDLLYCVKETNDGGYIATGVYTRNGIEYAWLVKVDREGNLEWESTELPNPDFILPTYIQQTNDGGYIICGVYQAEVKVGKYKGFLWKVDENGDTEWIKSYVERIWVVLEEEDGYICTGYAALTEDDYAALLMKMNLNGEMQWKKVYKYGEGIDKGISLCKTNDGGYLIGGEAEMDGQKDFWMIKTDSNGNKEWDKTYGGPKDDTCYSRNCFQTEDGGYIMNGWTNSYGAGKEDVWVIKTDSNGNMEWNKTYGGEGTDYSWSMEKTLDSGYLLCITKNIRVNFPTADIWIVKIDENGNMLWNQTFGGNREDIGFYITETSDGGYIVAGRTESFSPSSDGWLIKVKNVPPNKPSPPQGEANGKINREYTYTTSTIDPNGDEVYYMFDWGDNTTSEWIGPFKSGETINASHTWKEEGTYKIRVKAKDVNGLESPWSDYTVVSMPKGVTWKLEKLPFIYLLLKFFFSFFLLKL